MPRRPSVPAYRHHKQSGQAIVTLPDAAGGRHDRLLGPYDTEESRQEYQRVIAEWTTNGRRPPRMQAVPEGISVNELIVSYWSHAQTYYRHADGTPTSEQDNIRLALRRLRTLYGLTPAAAFRSLALEALRETMITEGLCRGRINKDVDRIKRMFRWAASKEMLPEATFHSLSALKGLLAGRSGAKEMDPVRPVADALVEETLPYLTPPVRAMVQLQRHTGMRPGEVVAMRTVDLDTGKPAWVYRPGSDKGPHGKHKTAHRGHQRNIIIGPRGQEVLKPWLRLNLTEYLFQPKDGRAAHDAERRRKRKSKVTPSQAARQLKRNPKRAPRDRYTTSAYAHAVEKGCIKAHAASCEACKRQKEEKRKEWLAKVVKCPGLPEACWHPNRLRHTKATEIRKEAGIDAARAVLGHRSPKVTEVYAELDVGTASAIMQRLG